MEHTKLYKQIIENQWYPTPWNKSMLRNAVEKGKLFISEYEEITGEEY